MVVVFRELDGGSLQSIHFVSELISLECQTLVLINEHVCLLCHRSLEGLHTGVISAHDSPTLEASNPFFLFRILLIHFQ